MTTPPDGPPQFPPVPAVAPEPPRKTRYLPLILLTGGVGVVIGLVISLVAHNRSADDAPAATPSTSVTTQAPASQSPSASSPSPPAAAGCAPNSATAPVGSDVVTVVDVDGDGRNDQAWISPGTGREFGITTASGATFSIPIESAAPEPASAVVNLVQTDKLPIALVSTGREALVYSLAQCEVRPVANAQGQPYTFDLGFAGTGTGVGCSGPSLDLAGLNAVVAAEDGTFTVTRTFVTLDADARHATNGSPEQVADGAAADDPVVTTAKEVSCGELVAGDPADGPVEPQ